MTDVEYTYGYYGELNPLSLAFALVASGYEAPRIQYACELGFGQGLSVNFHSSSSDISWWGTDFHPSHANFALKMSRFTGAHIFNEAFAEFCSRPDLPNFDFIGLHGIWSWVSEDNRNLIIDFINRKLRMGGVVYLSYNAMPGWAYASPLKHLISEYYDTMTAHGDGEIKRMDASLRFIDELFSVNPLFLKQTPAIEEAYKRLKSQPHDYLAHEYLNKNWRLWYFSEVAQQMRSAKLSFATSAKTTDSLELLNLTPDQSSFINRIHDPIYKESISDFIISRHFRRDYWVKGARKLNLTEKYDALRSMHFVLTFPAGEIPRLIPTRYGEAKLAPEVYDPLLILLKDHRPRSISEIETFMTEKGVSFQRVLDALLLLNGKGFITPAHDNSTADQMKKKTDALNRKLMADAKGGEQIPFLVSPVTGGGFPTWRFEKLICLSLLEGKKEVRDIASNIWGLISPYGQKLVKDGMILETPEDNLKELERLADSFIKERLDAFRGLKII